jgi:hypothetical protein
MTAPRVLGPSDDHLATLGGTSARFMIEGASAGKRFALVEHPMQPRALAAPMHRHHREDEYSFVLGRQHRSSARRYRCDWQSRGPDLQAARTMAYLLERGRRAGPYIGNHIAGWL